MVKNNPGIYRAKSNSPENFGYVHYILPTMLFGILVQSNNAINVMWKIFKLQLFNLQCQSVQFGHISSQIIISLITAL